MNPAKPVHAAAEQTLWVAYCVAVFAAAWELRPLIGDGIPLFVPVVVWATLRLCGRRTSGAEVLSPPAMLVYMLAPIAGCVLFAAVPWPLAARTAVLALSVLASAAAALWHVRGAAARPFPRHG